MISSKLFFSKPVLRERDGSLTAELVQEPGQFGLGRVPSRLAPTAVTSSICGFCSTGCSLTIHLNEGQAVNLSPDPRYPVNLGMACPKGWESLTPLAAPDRAAKPLLRDAGGRLQPVSWDRAAAVFVDQMRAIQSRHGAESAAFISTGQIPLEEMAFLGAFAKFGMGMVHGDGNTRQCMATAVAAYKQSFGFDAPPYTYADFEESDAIVLVGSNLCIAHPIMWQRVMQNRRNPEIIVIDPRSTETASAATLHLPLRPKSDLVLFYGVARDLWESGRVDRKFLAAHTTGFDGFAEFLRDYPRERVLRETGLTAKTFDRFVETVATRGRVSFWWTMGVNQSHQATRTAQAIINLALMTGNIGRAGTGANSITGQCNAMGSRLFSNTTNLLGGHDFANPAHRDKVARVLGIDATLIPTRNSLAYDQILDAVEDGRIRALWIIATNPVHSWIGNGRWENLRKKLDFLVVQDMYHSTETARVADLVLPAAGWGEKDGTFINSERRIGRIRKVSRAPGVAMADFHIFRLLATAWGCGEMFARWTSPETVFQILKEITRDQPCEITGIRNYDHLDEMGGIQWPFRAADTAQCEMIPRNPDVDHGGHGEGALKIASPLPNSKIQIFQERRLFEDGRFFTPDGRARFLFDPPVPMPEPVDAQYPFLLLTGRGSSSQWHTQTRTNKSDVLRKLYPQNCHFEINPDDAGRLKIRRGQKVSITSRRGTISARATLTPAVARGQIFLPMHYPAVNRLTLEVVDPHSRQPSYKACAVRLHPDGLPSV